MSRQFSRIELMIGKGKLKRLHQSHVAVIGLGAVGSFCVEALARSGVGHLTLADCDKVEETNLNRQLFALHSTLGKRKTDVARQRVLDIYPQCKVDPVELFAHAETIPLVLEKKPDLIVDAIDSLNPKVNILAAIVRAQVPVISSMGAATRTDLGLIRFGDLFSARGCSLARTVRQRLRRLGITEGIECVYSTEISNKEALGELGEGQMGLDQGRKRRPMGSLPTVTAVFGLTVAHHALKFLLGGSFSNVKE
ncbi:MAG TPA: tRNA threonylcarbamoyladenosine dehydratase [Candidatus Omnitrophota bacterium]|nr:tRNA threonylcarbamoyladenosine dehydratase [Candidatus Omnitrophota bacterium]HSA31904.1 tRNA threonylcarbamoyladenosine dehydratase [Candidatus Omnitrophota bacterium]